MKCVAEDANGFLFTTAETYPACSELVIANPADFSKLTYWADLSVQLEPGQPGAWEFYAATLGVFITAFGVKQVARLILNR